MALEAPVLYGLDIETDTTDDGLDPRVARVLAVAVAAPWGHAVFTGEERALLCKLDRHLLTLAPGVLVTWNGAAFDLPFLTSRAAVAGVDLGLRLTLDPAIPMRRDPLPGHLGAYRAAWHDHRHLDAYRLYRGDVRRTLNVSCGLKSIARLVGLPAVDVERSRIHELAPPELAAYVASDADLARLLAARRWPTASRCVDSPGGAPPGPSGRVSARAARTAAPAR